MDHDALRPSIALRRLVNGYQVTQAIHVAAVLGIADLLADGPRSSDDLAAATETHSGRRTATLPSPTLAHACARMRRSP